MSVHTVEGVARLSYEIVEQRGGAVGEGEGQWEEMRERAAEVYVCSHPCEVYA